jgi:ribonucrease Y
VARDALEEELLARRTEIARLEERLRAKESSLDVQAQQLSERERSLEDRRRNLDHIREELKTEKARQLRELERVSGLSAGQAKQILMHELEDNLRHDSARIIRQVEEETRRDADRRSRSILAAVMHRATPSKRRSRWWS